MPGQSDGELTLLTVPQKYYNRGDKVEQCFDGFASRVELSNTTKNGFGGTLTLRVNGEERINQRIVLDCETKIFTA